ncbi:MAG: GAP family protein [Microthrixaceae bacterium]
MLALTDSVSFGTLLVPVWLLMSPGRLRLARIVLYLATIAVAYFLIGVAMVFGGRMLAESAGALLTSSPAQFLQLALGIVLLIVSFALDTKAARARAAQRGTSGRMSRWRDRAMGGTSASPALITLALTAVAVEIASMLPYLAATGIITTQTSNWTTALLVLGAYCLAMIAPALVLAIGRVTARGVVDQPLRKLDGWLTRNARSTTLWIVGIAGFFLAATAIQSLGWVS